MTEQTSVRVQPIKVRRGLYKLLGVTHTNPRRRTGDVCGGQVFAERFGPYGVAERFGPYGEEGEVIPGSWECYCERCQDCDPNGWATLKECVCEAPDFWMQTPLPMQALESLEEYARQLETRG